MVNIHLQNPLPARAWPTDDFNIVSLQVSACFFQVGDFEGDMRTIANGQFIGAVTPRLHLGSISRLSFTDQVDLGTYLTKPVAREGEIAWTGNFLHSKYLTVTTAYLLDILDK